MSIAKRIMASLLIAFGAIQLYIFIVNIDVFINQLKSVGGILNDIAAILFIMIFIGYGILNIKEK